MMRAFGQDDKELAESIRKEEEFAALLFKTPPAPEPEPVIVLEAEPVLEPVIEEPVVEQPVVPEPAPAFTPPVANTIQQVKNVLDTVVNPPPPSIVTALANKEIEGIKKTLAEVMKKMGTLSWGGGGTGIVRIFDADDFDRNSVGNGKYMKWQDGWFVMDEINPYEVVHNTTLVTTNTYAVLDTDYYIGINYAGPVTITIPGSISSGREIVIKDESGNCETHNITVSAKVDNDANGFILAVNNGAVHMLYRGDSWRII